MLLQVFGIPCPQWLWWEVRYVCLSFFLPPHNVYVNFNFFHSSLVSSLGIHLPLLRSVDDVAAFFQHSWEEGYLKWISFEVMGLVLPLDFPSVLSREI